MPYTVEKFMRVYNDQTGDYVEVREDRDSLELIEIQNSESKHCVTMKALLLRDAITEVVAHIQNRKGE